MVRLTSIFAALFAAVVASTTSAFAPSPAFGTNLATATTTELGVKVKIEVGDGEPIESAIRRFKREVNKSGHLMDLRHKRYFENSQARKKRKIVQARNRKRLERMQKRRMANRT